MQNIKEWLGKSLIVRIEHENTRVKKLEDKIKQLMYINTCNNVSFERKALIRMIDRGFKVFENEEMSWIDGDDDGVDTAIWLSCSSDSIINKRYHFMFRNGIRVLHGNYLIAYDAVEYTDYVTSIWDNGKCVTTKKKGDKILYDNVDITEPLYPKCQTQKIDPAV